MLPGVAVNDTLLHDTPELGPRVPNVHVPMLTPPDDRSPDDHGDDVVGYGLVALELRDGEELVFRDDVVFVELRVLEDVVVGRELECVELLLVLVVFELVVLELVVELVLELVVELVLELVLELVFELVVELVVERVEV